MNEDMMTEAERASKLAEPAANDTPTRGKGVFYVHTLGCQMNVHDSERIAGVLEADGYVPATEEQYLNHDIDLIVMNTCAVRENAAERMYGTIGLWAELKRERPNLQYPYWHPGGEYIAYSTTTPGNRSIRLRTSG